MTRVKVLDWSSIVNREPTQDEQIQKLQQDIQAYRQFFDTTGFQKPQESKFDRFMRAIAGNRFMRGLGTVLTAIPRGMTAMQYASIKNRYGRIPTREEYLDALKGKGNLKPTITPAGVLKEVGTALLPMVFKPAFIQGVLTKSGQVPSSLKGEITPEELSWSGFLSRTGIFSPRQLQDIYPGWKKFWSGVEKIGIEGVPSPLRWIGSHAKQITPAGVGGLALDIFADPITYIGGAGIGKAIFSKTGFAMAKSLGKKLTAKAIANATEEAAKVASLTATKKIAKEASEELLKQADNTAKFISSLQAREGLQGLLLKAPIETFHKDIQPLIRLYRGAYSRVSPVVESGLNAKTYMQKRFTEKLMHYRLTQTFKKGIPAQVEQAYVKTFGRKAYNQAIQDTTKYLTLGYDMGYWFNQTELYDIAAKKLFGKISDLRKEFLNETSLTGAKTYSLSKELYPKVVQVSKEYISKPLEERMPFIASLAKNWRNTSSPEARSLLVGLISKDKELKGLFRNTLLEKYQNISKFEGTIDDFMDKEITAYRIKNPIDINNENPAFALTKESAEKIAQKRGGYSIIEEIKIKPKHTLGVVPFATDIPDEIIIPKTAPYRVVDDTASQAAKVILETEGAIAETISRNSLVEEIWKKYAKDYIQAVKVFDPARAKTLEKLSDAFLNTIDKSTQAYRKGIRLLYLQESLHPVVKKQAQKIQDLFDRIGYRSTLKGMLPVYVKTSKNKFIEKTFKTIVKSKEEIDNYINDIANRVLLDKKASKYGFFSKLAENEEVLKEIAKRKTIYTIKEKAKTLLTDTEDAKNILKNIYDRLDSPEITEKKLFEIYDKNALNATTKQLTKYAAEDLLALKEAIEKGGVISSKLKRLMPAIVKEAKKQNYGALIFWDVEDIAKPTKVLVLRDKIITKGKPEIDFTKLSQRVSTPITTTKEVSNVLSRKTVRKPFYFPGVYENKNLPKDIFTTYIKKEGKIVYERALPRKFKTFEEAYKYGYVPKDLGTLMYETLHDYFKRMAKHEFADYIIKNFGKPTEGVLKKIPRKNLDQTEGIALRKGEISPSGAYFATPGSSGYADPYSSIVEKVKPLKQTENFIYQPEPAPSWYKEVKDPLYKGYVFEPDIADAIDRLQLLAHDANVKLLAKVIFDYPLRIFKYTATVINLGFHIRNAISNYWLLFLKDGARTFDPERNALSYAISMAETFGVGKKQVYKSTLRNIVDETGKEVTLKQFINDLKRRGILGGFFQEELATKPLQPLTGSYASRLLKNYTGKAINFPVTVGGFIEDQARILGVLNDLYKYAPKIGYKKAMDYAAERVFKFLFDYSDLSSFEKTWMRRIMPFYTWLRKNIALQVEQLLDQPGKFALIEKVRRFEEGLSADAAGEYQYLPEYMKKLDVWRTPMVEDGKRLYWNPNIAFQDLNKLGDVTEMFSALNPMIRVPFELMTNKNLYFGTPISSGGGLTKAPLPKLPGLKKILDNTPARVLEAFGIFRTAKGEYLTTQTRDYLARNIPVLYSLAKTFPLQPEEGKDVERIYKIYAFSGIKFIPFDVKEGQLKTYKQELEKYQQQIQKLKQLGLLPEDFTIEHIRKMYPQYR